MLCKSGVIGPRSRLACGDDVWESARCFSARSNGSWLHYFPASAFCRCSKCIVLVLGECSQGQQVSNDVGLLVCKRHVQASHPPVHVSQFFTISFSIRKFLCMYDVVEVGQPPAPPPGVGVLYAANHPNALLDGALLMYALRFPPRFYS